MDRIIVSGPNHSFPRLVTTNGAPHSGTTPESAAGGTCPPKDDLTSNAPQGAGLLTAARRPRVSLLKAVAAVALWDSRQFCTAQIADVLGMKECQVASVLSFIREERRARR